MRFARMTRYFFDLHNRTGATTDEEGRELSNLDDAREAAVRDIRSLLSAEVHDGTLDMKGHMTVRKDGGGDVLYVAFTEALHVRAPGD
ncbi:DUF6894 family protein [Sphingomonas sp. ID0503]|uniref:DUF6894 family protein n=1 Tax=Sphingomonas sp. ID0503 TaxID=3399691 RepID=UPI003AFB420E